MFGPRVSYGLNTVSDLQEQVTLCSLHSLLATQAAQMFTCNSWTVQSCGINLGKAEKQDKGAGKSLFPSEPPWLMWHCLQSGINNQLQPQGGSGATIKAGLMHRGAAEP